MPRAINTKRIDAQEYDRIVQRLKQGASLADVAAEFNRGINTVRRFAARVR